MPLAPTRGALLAHGPNPNRPSTLPAMGTHLASQANRDGVAARCAAPAVHTSLEVDLALVSSSDARLRDVARPIVQTATQHDATTLSRLHTVPGIGTMLRLVRRDAIHHIDRCPRGQEVASSCRLVKCAKASNGNRSALQGPQWAMPISPGRFPKRPSSAGGSIPLASHAGPDGRKNTTQARHGPLSLIHARVPSLTCASARSPLLGQDA